MPTNLPPTPTAAIRQIFSDRRSYTVEEVARLVNIDARLLTAEIETGELEGGIAALPWREVAYLVLRRWPITVIFEALGSDAETYVPALLRPITITTTLPAYQVRMLEVLAHRQQLDVSTFLQLHLLDLASVESPLLAEQIDGFAEALHFPLGEER